MLNYVIFFATKRYIKSQTIGLFYMIAKTLTELYLRHFNQLHGTLCLCWQTASCCTTKQLNTNKLKEQITQISFYAILTKYIFTIKLETIASYANS